MSVPQAFRGGDRKAKGRPIPTLMRLACRFEGSRPILLETEANSSPSKILGCEIQDMKVGITDAGFAFELECR